MTIRYFGLTANAHRGKVRKSGERPHKLIIVEEECSKIPRRGWAEMIRNVYGSQSDITGKKETLIKLLN